MKVNSKEEFIKEAEKRGLKEGVAFRCACADQVAKAGWTWDDMDNWSGGSFYCDKNMPIVSNGKEYKNYIWLCYCGKWATPLETPLEDRVKALEDHVKYLQSNKQDKGLTQVYSSKFEINNDCDESKWGTVYFNPPDGWNGNHKQETKPTQSSRHFIMEGIIEKIYPKDKEKALEALVNVARIDREVFDNPKGGSDYQDELSWSSNAFFWEDTEQGVDYWEEIFDLLK